MTNLDRATRVAGGIGLAALAGVAFLALVGGFPASSGPGSMGMMGGAGMMGGSGPLFVLFPFLALASILAFGYAGVRAVATAGEDERTDDPAADDPIARLQRRYTEGDLTEAEFERALDRELAEETRDGDGELDDAERSARLRER
ncbi:SHOCT domain-containing protein [Halorubrum halophilum]|uniref:SHOCT domain-containing protein n=1 Tax=Halorubrum halophilum TaxID=413816 RepID=UPI00186AD675|nr:SHOCT domain-containing protein [Halorubrum halophilum]